MQKKVLKYKENKSKPINTNENIALKKNDNINIKDNLNNIKPVLTNMNRELCSSYKSKQMQELQRLQSICFPQKAINDNKSSSITKEIDFSKSTTIPNNYTRTEKTRSSVQVYSNIEDENLLDDSISWLNPNEDHISATKGKSSIHFNQDSFQVIRKSTKGTNNNSRTLTLNTSQKNEPIWKILSLEDENKNDEFDESDSMRDYKVKEKLNNTMLTKLRRSFNGYTQKNSKFLSRSLTPDKKNRFIDVQNFARRGSNAMKVDFQTPIRSSLNSCNLKWSIDQLLHMDDCKAKFAKENFWSSVDNLTGNMKSFVNNLFISLKDVCLTKTSEKTINTLMKKYILRLETLKNNWEEHSNLNPKDYDGNLKHMLGILRNCFDDIMDKISELVYKLKNFNSVQFNQLAQRGLLCAFNLIINQDYTLNMEHIFLNFCESLTQFRITTAVIRLYLISKSKINCNKMVSFQSLYVYAKSIKKNQQLNKFLTGFIKLEAIGKIKDRLRLAMYIKQWTKINHQYVIKNEITHQNLHKSLITSILTNIHDEIMFFKIISKSLTSIIKIKNTEILLYDKVHRILYGNGYVTSDMVNRPKSQKTSPARKSYSKNQFMLIEEQYNSSGYSNFIDNNDYNDHLTPSSFMDSIQKSQDNFDYDDTSKQINSRQEISLEPESLVKHCIIHKEIVNMGLSDYENCNQNPTMALFNKEIDIALINKVRSTYPSQYGPKKNLNFIYYPLCNSLKEVVGMIRVFPQKDEVMETDIIDKITRFADTLIPILEQVIPLRKELEYSSNSGSNGLTKQQQLIKNIIIDGLKMLWTTNNTSTILSNLANIIIDQLKIDNVAIYTINQEGKLGKIFSQNHLSVITDEAQPWNLEKETLDNGILSKEIAHNLFKSMTNPVYYSKNPKLFGVAIPISDPITAKLIGALEFEKKVFGTSDASIMKIDDYSYNKQSFSPTRTNSLHIYNSPYKKNSTGLKNALDQYHEIIPYYLIEYLPHLFMNALNALQKSPNEDLENHTKALQDQLTEIQDLNSSLKEKLNYYELLHNVTLKLKDSVSFEDVVMLFNQTFSNSSNKPEYAALFFMNAQNSTYFTYNYLLENMNNHQNNLKNQNNLSSKLTGGVFDNQTFLYVLDKNESLLSKLFDTLSPNQILNVNHEDTNKSILDNLIPHKLKEIASDCTLLSFPLNKDTNTKDGKLQPLSQRNMNVGEEDSCTFSQSNDYFKMKSYSTSKIIDQKTKHLQNLLIVPIVFNDKIIGFITLGNSSTNSKFKINDENFTKDFGQLLQSYFIDKYMLNDSMLNLTQKLNKSIIKSSKMKAYRSLLVNQNLKPEYNLYKKHHNIQSLIYFMESNYIKLLNAQSARVLLYNETKNNLYYYLKITSTKVIELIPNSIHNSITGNCIIKNEPFIYPILSKPITDESHSGIHTNASVITENHFYSFRSRNNLPHMEFRNQQNHINKSKQNSFSWDYPITSSEKENNPFFAIKDLSSIIVPMSVSAEVQSDLSYSMSASSRHDPLNSQLAFEKLANYNHLIDAYKPYDENDELVLGSLNYKKITSFLCYPLADKDNKIIGVIQVFNKQDNKFFNKKDLSKASAINEALLKKLKKLSQNPLSVHSVGILKSCQKIANITKNYSVNFKRFAFNILRKYKELMVSKEKKNALINAAADRVKALIRKRLSLFFEKLKFDVAYEKLRASADRQNRTLSDFMLKKEALMIMANVLRINQMRIILSAFSKINKWVYHPIKIYNTKSTNTMTHDENIKLKGMVLKNLNKSILQKMKRIGMSMLQSSDETSRTQILNSSIESVKSRTMCTTLKLISNKTLREGFYKLKSLGSLSSTKAIKNETSLAKDAYFSLSYEEKSKNILNLYSTLYEFFKDIHRDSVSIKTCFTDIENQKYFCYNSYNHSIMKIYPSNNQLEYIKKALKNEYMLLSNSNSIFDNNLEMMPYQLYYSFSINEKFNETCKDPKLIVEISLKKNTNIRLSKDSKSIIQTGICTALKKSVSNIEQLFSILIKLKTTFICRAFFTQVREHYQKNSFSFNNDKNNNQGEQEGQSNGKKDSISKRIAHTSIEPKNKGAAAAPQKKDKIRYLLFPLVYSIAQLVKLKKQTLKQSFLKWKILAFKQKISESLLARSLRTRYLPQGLPRRIISKSFDCTSSMRRSLIPNFYNPSTPLAYQNAKSKSCISKHFSNLDCASKRVSIQKNNTSVDDGPSLRASYSSSIVQLSTPSNYRTSVVRTSPIAKSFSPNPDKTASMTYCLNPRQSFSKQGNDIISREASPIKNLVQAPSPYSSLCSKDPSNQAQLIQSQSVSVAYNSTCSELDNPMYITFQTQDEETASPQVKQRSLMNENHINLDGGNNGNGISPLGLSNFPSSINGRNSVQNSLKSNEIDSLFSKYAKLYKEEGIAGRRSSISSINSTMQSQYNSIDTSQYQSREICKSPKKLNLIQYKRILSCMNKPDDNNNNKYSTINRTTTLTQGSDFETKINESTKRYLEEMDLKKVRKSQDFGRLNKKTENFNTNQSYSSIHDYNYDYNQINNLNKTYNSIKYSKYM